MENGRQLQVGLYPRGAGDTVTLDILRSEATIKVAVTIVERPDPLGDLTVSIDPRRNLVPRLGALAVSLDERIAAMLPMLRAASGVVIVSSVAGALESSDGGLAPGDIVHAVNRTPVDGLDRLRTALEPLAVGDPVVLQVERAGELMYLAFTIE
jgi:serine protease Do